MLIYMPFNFLFSIINKVLLPVWIFNVYDVITMGINFTLTETATLSVATFPVKICDISGRKPDDSGRNTTFFHSSMALLK